MFTNANNSGFNIKDFPSFFHEHTSGRTADGKQQS